jgi:hypothetical protein
VDLQDLRLKECFLPPRLVARLISGRKIATLKEYTCEWRLEALASVGTTVLACICSCSRWYGSGTSTAVRGRMVIYLFRDEGDADVFAFSIDVTGPNIPPITAHTEWVFFRSIRDTQVC